MQNARFFYELNTKYMFFLLHDNLYNSFHSTSLMDDLNVTYIDASEINKVLYMGNDLYTTSPWPRVVKYG